MTESESPFWVKYAVDFGLLIAFLFILFFVKPVQQDEIEGDPEPNPLEKILVTESECASEESNEEDDIEEQK